MAETNPIRDTYEALWAMLDGNADFSALFPAGTSKQVRYTSDSDATRDPDMEELQPAEYPRCRIVLVYAKPATQRTCDGSLLELKFAIEVCTGAQYQTRLMESCWAIYCAMHGWEDYIKDEVTYNDQPCVYDVDARGFEADSAKHDRNRGQKQWITVWETSVGLYFPSQDLYTPSPT